MNQIQITEVFDTNLLYIVTDSNLDGTYYNKSNLTVEAVDGYVVIHNEGVQVFKDLPRNFIEPLESSVIDLVEIIQGYISNLIPVVSDELEAIKEIIENQEDTFKLLTEIKMITECLNSLIEMTNTTNNILKKIYN